MASIIIIGVILALVATISVYVVSIPAPSQVIHEEPQPPAKKINEVAAPQSARPQKIGSVDVVPGGVSETEITVAR